jgi:hypothetical protein
MEVWRCKRGKEEMAFQGRNSEVGKGKCERFRVRTVWSVIGSGRVKCLGSTTEISEVSSKISILNNIDKIK